MDDDYFERLLEEIREIRLSERRFYQKITDIYATAMDYDKNAKTTQTFLREFKQTSLGGASTHCSRVDLRTHRQ